MYRPVAHITIFKVTETAKAIIPSIVQIKMEKYSNNIKGLVK